MKESELTHRLREWMQREKIRQPEAAERLGVPYATFRGWVTGRRQPWAGSREVIERTLAGK